MKTSSRFRRNNTEIVLCIDHMHINQSTFLTTIDETVKFRQCIPMENTTTDTVFKALDKIGLLKKGYTHSSSMIRRGTKRHFKMAIKSQEWMIPNKVIWKKPLIRTTNLNKKTNIYITESLINLTRAKRIAGNGCHGQASFYPMMSSPSSAPLS